jgi:hypothetical protein
MTSPLKPERGRNEEEELATRRTEILDRQRDWLDVSK